MSQLVAFDGCTLALCCSLAGCATTIRPAFDTHLPDNEPAAIRRVTQRLGTLHAPSPEPHRPAMVIATTRGPAAQLLAYDAVRGEVSWRTSNTPKTRPQIVAGRVLTSIGSRVVALDLGTGRERWSTPAGDLPWLGAAGSNEQIVLVASSGTGGARAGRSVVRGVDADTGAQRWRHEVRGALGQPAVASGLVFVPWDQQSLVVLDLRTGNEVARIRAQDSTIRWVEATPTGVFYGDATVHRWGSRQLEADTAAESRRHFDFAALPTAPKLRPSGFRRHPTGSATSERIALRFGFETRGEAGIALEGNRAYFVFYRYVFGLTDSGELVWASVLEHDVVASAANPHGLVVLDREGRLRMLDRETGLLVRSASVGTQLSGATLDIVGLQPSHPPGERVPLRLALNAIAFDPDNRLVLARKYAIAHLARSDAAEATRDLLELYAERSTPPLLRREIARALGTRSVGGPWLERALESHYDFLRGTRPPPLSIIAPALVKQRARHAVPALVRHMLDHETPIAELPAVVRAISELGDASVVPPLVEFVQRYRADSTFAEAPRTMQLALTGLARHGGATARERLQTWARAPGTLPVLAKAARKLAEEREPVVAVAAARTDAPRVEAALPAKRTQAEINRGFVPYLDELRACLAQELARNPSLSEVRIAFVINPDGIAHAFGFVPDSPAFAACLGPQLAHLHFTPARERQLASYVIALRGRTPPPTKGRASEPVTPLAWWSHYAERAGHRAQPGDLRPWWRAPRDLASSGHRNTESSPLARSAQPHWWQNAETGAQELGKDSAQVEPAVTAADEPTKKRKEAPKEEPAEPEPADAWWTPERR